MHSTQIHNTLYTIHSTKIHSTKIHNTLCTHTQYTLHRYTIHSTHIHSTHIHNTLYTHTQYNLHTRKTKQFGKYNNKIVHIEKLYMGNKMELQGIFFTGKFYCNADKGHLFIYGNTER